MSRHVAVVALGLTFVVPASSVYAFGSGGRGSQMGDSWLNDAQKNPRFIEPGADNHPSRYRASHPREGWYDRQRASQYGYGRPHYDRRYGY